MVVVRTILKTESLCPYCLERIPASYVERDGQVYFDKECQKHGKFQTLFWRDVQLYENWLAQSVHAENKWGKRKLDKGCPFDCGLCVEHEGGVCTAVLEITYRCNMQCTFCFADAQNRCFDPDLWEIKRMYETAYDSGGYCSVQLSGGEPTLRADLPNVISMGKEMGFPHIQVNTNGLKLAEDRGYAQELKSAGADLIYLQFDGLNDDIYLKIRGRRLLNIKQKAIENCALAGLGVLLVPTIVSKVNLDSVGEIVEYAKNNLPITRGIHFQPVSYFGRYPHGTPRNEDRCSLSDVLHALEKQTAGEIKLEDLVPRKRYDAHCAFSGLFFLPEGGRLQAITSLEQNALLTEETDFAKKSK